MNPRSLLGLGSTTVLVGIAAAVTTDPLVGGLITLPSLVILIYGLHRFGRSGPDAPMDLGA